MARTAQSATKPEELWAIRQLRNLKKTFAARLPRLTASVKGVALEQEA